MRISKHFFEKLKIANSLCCYITNSQLTNDLNIKMDYLHYCDLVNKLSIKYDNSCLLKCNQFFKDLIPMLIIDDHNFDFVSINVNERTIIIKQRNRYKFKEFDIYDIEMYVLNTYQKN